MIRKRRSQAERRLESEQGLLEAAAQVIVEHGYLAATFERIGQRAGYSSSLVTARFGSKDGLFVAMIDFLSARYESYFERHAQAFPSGRARVLGLLEAFQNHQRQDPLGKAYYILLAAAIANKLPQKEYFLKRHRIAQDNVQRILRDAVKDGSIAANTDSEVVSYALGCLFLGMAMQTQLSPAMEWPPIEPVMNLLDGALSDKR